MPGGRSRKTRGSAAKLFSLGPILYFRGCDDEYWRFTLGLFARKPLEKVSSVAITATLSEETNPLPSGAIVGPPFMAANLADGEFWQWAFAVPRGIAPPRPRAKQKPWAGSHSSRCCMGFFLPD